MNIIDKAREALQGDCRAAELDGLHVALRIHLNTKGDRLKAIVTKDLSTFGGGPGPERQAVIAAGDLDALKALNLEEINLVAEMDIFRSLSKRMRAALDAAKAKEFIEAAPARYDELAKLLAGEAKAQAALQSARQATQSALNDLSAQREHVVIRGATSLKFPPASDVLLRQLMQARDFTYSTGPQRVGWFSPQSGGPAQLAILAGTLGLAVPHPAAMAAA